MFHSLETSESGSTAMHTVRLWPKQLSPYLLHVTDFSGEQVVQRHMSRLGRELLYHRIEAASSTDDRKALELVLQEYGMVLQQAACEHASVIIKYRKGWLLPPPSLMLSAS